MLPRNTANTSIRLSHAMTFLNLSSRLSQNFVAKLITKEKSYARILDNICVKKANIFGIDLIKWPTKQPTSHRQNSFINKCGTLDRIHWSVRLHLFIQSTRRYMPTCRFVSLHLYMITGRWWWRHDGEIYINNDDYKNNGDDNDANNNEHNVTITITIKIT